MKRLSLCVALLICCPVLALGQARRGAPAPPLPPAPPVAPAPMVAPVPPVPPAPPVAPVAPLLAFRDSLGVLDSLDLQFDIDNALRDVRRAVEEIDFEAVADKVKGVAIDVDGLDDLTDRLRVQADQVRFQTDDMKETKEQMKSQAEAVKEQVKAQAKMATDRAMQAKDFSFQMRGPNGVVIGPGGSESSLYNNGLNAVNRRQYDQAITYFDRAIAQKGGHADGSFYWKAYAQYKLGKSDDALASIAELRRSYASSRYLTDSRVLEADVRKTTGKPLTGDADTDEIKLLAISSMQNTNPDGAIPLLENVLKATNSLQVKKKALYVLAINDQPAAHQILLTYAKGGGSPELQIEAIRYLVDRKNKTTTAELEAIYSSTQDLDVKRAVLDALVSSGDRPAVMKLMAPNTPIEIRRRVISTMGNNNLATPQEIMQLYQKEEDRNLKQEMVNALRNMGAVDQLTQIIKSEKEPSVRQSAIRALGNMKTEQTGKVLADLYSADQDKDTRKSVISALGNQNNAEGLVAIARKETTVELKVEIVRRIADIAPKNKVAMDYIMEQIK